MNFVFFRRPKPRSFNYRPMYYDPIKEKAEERKKARNSMQEGDFKDHMRAEIRRKWRAERKETDKRNQVIRIFFYFIFASFLIYVIFFTEFMTKMVSLFLL